MSVLGASKIAEMLNEDPDFLLWCLDVTTDSPFNATKPSPLPPLPPSSATSSSSALSSTYSCSSLDAMDDLSGSEDEIHSSSSVHGKKRTKRYHDPLDDYLDRLYDGESSPYIV